VCSSDLELASCVHIKFGNSVSEAVEPMSGV
jgi:hypothetical protein